MFEADFDSEFEFTGFKEVNKDTRNMYLKARLAEQSERRQLLDMFHEGIIPKLIGLHLKMELTKYPDSISGEIQQLKELVDSAIENAHILTNEISPHVLFRAGLRDALHELFRKYAGDFGLRYYINVKNADLDLLDETTSSLLYHISKNLITGTIHSCFADTIGITLRTTGNTAELVIQDNGSYNDDFDKIVATGQSHEQAFLLEAAEQIYSLGGKFWIDKSIGLRTICVSIPLKLVNIL